MSTKKLARELGLIRKRSQSSSAEKNPAGTNQLFSYLIVIDFESTCWREKNNYGQEIIEFPAVLLNTSNGEIESEFHSYVQPQEHPILSEFCTELTGITQKQVEAGLPLRICLSRFTRWLQTLQQEKGVVYVTDSKNTPSSGQLCTFITWSDWDLGVCLLYECKRKQIVKPEALSSWIDLRATYRTFYSRKPKGLNGALQDLGIQFSGREHSGLDDARNTARLAWRMVTDGCVLKVTKSLNRAPVKSRPLFGQGRVHSKSPSKTRPPVEENLPTPFSNHSNGSSTGNPNTGTGVCQNLVPTRTVLTSLVTPVFVNTPHLHTTLQNTTPTSPVGAASELEMAGCDWAEGFLVTEVGESGSYDDVVLEDVEWGIVDRDDSLSPGNHTHTEVNRPHPPQSQVFKPRPQTQSSVSVSLLSRPDPFKSLNRPGCRATTTTPSMPFTVYTDQLHQSSLSNSTTGFFKVPHPVRSLTVNQSKRTSTSIGQSKPSSTFVNQSALHSISINQSKLCSVSFNQSALHSISINQSKPSMNQSAHSSNFFNQSDASCSNNQSEHSSIFNNQSPSTSVSQSKPSSTFVNQSALSFTSKIQSAMHLFSKKASIVPASSDNQSNLSSFSVNQSALNYTSSNQSKLCSVSFNQSKHLSISNNQSVLASTSANQSALHSISINQSRASSSTNQSESSSICNTTISNNLSALSSSANQSRSSSTMNHSSHSSCYTNQSKLCSVSFNQSALNYTSSNQSKHLSISNNQSVLASTSANQSALHSISINQSRASSSTNQSESSSICNTTISNNLSALSSSANQSRSSSTMNHSSHSSCYTNQSKLCSVSFNQSAPLSRCSGRRSLPLCRSDGENSLVTKLPRVTKVTAPLCSCGRRAKRMTVGNGGPNHGRAFYSCPVRKSGPDPAHRGGCGFFKWESAVINSTLKPNSRISFSVQTAASRNFR
uniref:ERI1 exoribonuclease 2 n=1 Tax=Astyanax mexicanus TaxID=7994 RepID=A0A3B1IKK6_ASTMX